MNSLQAAVKNELLLMAMACVMVLVLPVGM